MNVLKNLLYNQKICDCKAIYLVCYEIFPFSFTPFHQFPLHLHFYFFPCQTSALHDFSILHNISPHMKQSGLFLL